MIGCWLVPSDSLRGAVSGSIVRLFGIQLDLITLIVYCNPSRDNVEATMDSPSSITALLATTKFVK